MISIKGLTKTYPSGRGKMTVLDEINLEVQKGEFISIMGKSGSGKTTLLNLIGLLDNFDSGSYKLSGVEMKSVDQRGLARTRNRDIGFVYQNFNLLANFSALDNVMLPQLFGGVPAQRARKKAQEFLELVGLGDKLKNRPTQLSGGEQQRVAIARALINEPELLLLDEPTGTLDSKTGAEILELVKTLWVKNKMTILVITHDREIAGEAQKTLHIKDGKIMEGSAGL
ncbi:MAG: ABC transporter ATP-binding protein [Bacillota bacterium]|nr:ABC transporter ATP-binding protein [Bacillota bacterium]